MSTPAAIRHLFLHPQATYPLPDAAAMLGTSVDELRGWMAVGEIEGVETKKGVVVPWEELVSFGMDFWSQEAVESALGVDALKVIPELLRLAELEVRIPRMQGDARAARGQNWGNGQYGARAGAARSRVRAR